MKYRMPAEWEFQEAVWFAWPTDKTLWPGNFANILEKFAKLITTVAQYTPVKLICADENKKLALKILKEHGAKYHQVQLVNIETNDVWCRDFGPIFVKDENDELAITDWQFNAWGGKYDFELDNVVNDDIAVNEDCTIINIDTILEGGAIDVNGAGLLLTTEEVLLNDNRNKDISKEKYEKLFKQYLGIEKTIWLKSGIAHDDTDGHIDNLARFIDTKTIMIASERDEDSTNFIPLQENMKTIQDFVSEHCLDLKIIEVPLPDKVIHAKEELPASHLNFLMTNELILVPTYNSSTDKAVLTQFRKIFPTKTVQGFDCSDFLQEGGAIHCLTQQQPL